MGRGKELLLFLIVMMHCSSIVSKPVTSVQLQEKMKTVKRWAMQNLDMAQELYVLWLRMLSFLLETDPDGSFTDLQVEDVYEKDPPQQFVSHTWKPLDGITLPVGNSTKEIQDSICAIRNYLEDLPNIISTITVSPLTEWLLSNVTAFTREFKKASEMAVSGRCNITSDTNVISDTYQMKEDGLKMIYFTQRWLTEYTDGQPSQSAP